MSKTPLLTVRCPQDILDAIAATQENTRRNKTEIVIDLLRNSVQSVAIMERSKLPKSPAIYLVYTPLNELLYIGRSDSLFDTWLMHDRFQEFIEAHQESRVAWFEIDPESMPIVDLSKEDCTFDYEGNLSSNRPSNENYITKDDWNEFIKNLQETLPAQIREILNAEYAPKDNLASRPQPREIEQEHERLEAENQNLLAQIKTLKEQNGLLQTENDKLNKELKDSPSQEDLEDLENQNNDLMTENDELREQISFISEKLDRAIAPEDFEGLEFENEELKKRVRELQEKLKQYSDKQATDPNFEIIEDDTPQPSEDTGSTTEQPKPLKKTEAVRLVRSRGYAKGVKDSSASQYFSKWFHEHPDGILHGVKMIFKGTKGKPSLFVDTGTNETVHRLEVPARSI